VFVDPLAETLQQLRNADDITREPYRLQRTTGRAAVERFLTPHQPLKAASPAASLLLTRILCGAARVVCAGNGRPAHPQVKPALELCRRSILPLRAGLAWS